VLSGLFALMVAGIGVGYAYRVRLGGIVAPLKAGVASLAQRLPGRRQKSA
jgi:type III secretion protein J